MDRVRNIIQEELRKLISEVNDDTNRFSMPGYEWIDFKKYIKKTEEKLLEVEQKLELIEDIIYFQNNPPEIKLNHIQEILQQ